LTGPVLAFDINARKDGKLQKVTRSTKADAQTEPTPNIDVTPAVDPFAEKLRSRAQLASVYAGILGVEAVTSDVLEAMHL